MVRGGPVGGLPRPSRNSKWAPTRSYHGGSWRPKAAAALAHYVPPGRSRSSASAPDGDVRARRRTEKGHAQDDAAKNALQRKCA